MEFSVLNEVRYGSCRVCGSYITGPGLYYFKEKEVAHADCAGFTLIEQNLGKTADSIRIQSKYKSKCNLCKKPVHKGDWVFWTPGSKGVIHDLCDTNTYNITTKAYRAVPKGSLLKDADSKLKEIADNSIYLKKTFEMSDDAYVKDFPDLMEHQAKIVNTMQREDSMLLAADIGTGKTFASLASAAQRNAFPLLVVCPAVMKYQFQAEVKRWLGKDAQILSTKTPYDINADIVIINYDILYAWKRSLIDYNFTGVIFDESHMLANPDAKRTKAALSIAKNIKFKMALSGTPIKNSPADLWPTLRILNMDNKFPSKKAFMLRYAPEYQTKYGTAHRSTHVLELNDNLKAIGMYRIKQEDCIDLPDIIKTNMPVETKHKAGVLDELVKHMHEATIKEANRVIDTYLDEDNIRGEIATIRKNVGIAKIDALVEYAEEIIDHDGLVIMVHHKYVQNKLKERLKKHNPLFITGGQSPAARQQNIDDFQHKKSNVIICSISAADVGLNLFRANKMIIGEMPWTHSDMMQLEGRIYRKGQTKKCQVVRLIATGTFDSTMIDIIERKRIAVMGGIDGINANKITPKEILAKELMRVYNDKYTN